MATARHFFKTQEPAALFGKATSLLGTELNFHLFAGNTEQLSKVCFFATKIQLHAVQSHQGTQRPPKHGMIVRNSHPIRMVLVQESICDLKCGYLPWVS